MAKFRSYAELREEGRKIGFWQGYKKAKAETPLYTWSAFLISITTGILFGIFLSL